MASAERVSYPARGQGIRIIVEDGGAQMTAAVESAQDSGALLVRVPPGPDPSELFPERVVTLQYFRDGVLFHLRSIIERVRSEPLDENGSVTWLELAVPRGARSVRRRRFPRVNVDVPVRYVRAEIPTTYGRPSIRGRWAAGRLDKQLERAALVVRTEVLGAGGLRMHTSEAINLDERLYMELEVAESSFRVAGRVVWVADPGETPGVGVEFLEVPEKVRYELNRFVRDRAAQLQAYGAM